MKYSLFALAILVLTSCGEKPKYQDFINLAPGYTGTGFPEEEMASFVETLTNTPNTFLILYHGNRKPSLRFSGITTGWTCDSMGVAA